MTYALTFGFYTKTITALKAEKRLRHRALYNARHKYDRLWLISVMLIPAALLTALPSTFV